MSSPSSAKEYIESAVWRLADVSNELGRDLETAKAELGGFVARLGESVPYDRYTFSAYCAIIERHPGCTAELSVLVGKANRLNKMFEWLSQATYSLEGH